MSKKNKAARSDGGFENVFLNSGVSGRDPLQATKFKPTADKSDQELIGWYKGNGLVQRIVDIYADEPAKNWIETDEKLLKALDDINAEANLANALRWSNLFGGSAVLMMINDGGGLEDEVNVNKIKSVDELKVYDKREVNLLTPFIDTDPLSRTFGKPQKIEIIPAVGNMFYVHPSRLLIFDGEPLPNTERQQRSGWGMPTIQNVFNAIENNDEAYRLARMIMERVSQSVTKFNGLNQQLATTEGEDRVKKRLQLIDMARSVMNTVAIDSEDDFQLFTMTMAGIPDLLDRFSLAVTALTGIPFTVLFGRSPAGMSATGQSDLEIFYGKMAQVQKRKLKGNLGTLIKYLAMPNKIKDCTFKFNPLWMPSAKELAETGKLESDTAVNYAKIGAISGFADVRPGLADKYALDESLDLTDFKADKSTTKSGDNK